MVGAEVAWVGVAAPRGAPVAQAVAQGRTRSSGKSLEKGCLATEGKRIVSEPYAPSDPLVSFASGPAHPRRPRRSASSRRFPFAHAAQIEDAPPASRGICPLRSRIVVRLGRGRVRAMRSVGLGLALVAC